MSRLRRKDEHVKYSLLHRPGVADFSEINFVHNCLPEKNLKEVSLESTLFGDPLKIPLFFNAVTGGTPLAFKINAALAEVARLFGLPMALGSQMVALEKPAAAASFQVVRRRNPRGIIWANIGAYASPEMVRRAVEMVEASAVQIHLNVPQELFMGEGDQRFQGNLDRIREIARRVEVPVIAKEVGFGVAGEQARQLLEAGVAAIDVGGRGGTNFLEIEGRRSGRRFSPELYSWGIPTAISLAEVLVAVENRIPVLAAGGMASSMNIAKALALGARAVGLAAMPVYILLKRGRQALIREIARLERELRLIMLMAGASSLEELRRVPLVITGFTAEWLQRRGIDPSSFTHRT